jgi:hypothetical protein
MTICQPRIWLLGDCHISLVRKDGSSRVPQQISKHFERLEIIFSALAMPGQATSTAGQSN